MRENEKRCMIPPRMRIMSLEAGIKNERTRFDETSSHNCLIYETPLFRASAKLRFPPIHDDSKWKIGFIQGCIRMKFEMDYSAAGVSSWEFPAMYKNEKAALNDSDSKNYPFYDAHNSSYEISGPTKREKNFQVTLHDHFNPWVPWKSVRKSSRSSYLRGLERDQAFLVWLVAINVTKRELYVFKTIRWEMYLKILVNPRERAGRRVKLVSNPQPPRPIIYEFNIPLPHEVMYPPTANSAQVLAWRRADECASILLVPPKYYDSNDNRHYASEKRSSDESSDSSSSSSNSSRSSSSSGSSGSNSNSSGSSD